MEYTEVQRVANSIALLDEYAAKGEFDWLPRDWRDKIISNKLDMLSCTNCVLGQLWWAATGQVDGYTSAATEMEGSGIEYSDPKYQFGSATAQWLKQLREPKATVLDGYTPGDAWRDSSGCCKRIFKTIFTVDGKEYVAYVSREGEELRTQLKSEFELAFKPIPKIRFTKGMRLKPANSGKDRYIYLSDEKVIRIQDNKMSWASLYYFESKYGKLISCGQHANDSYYFEMWNETK